MPADTLSREEIERMLETACRRLGGIRALARSDSGASKIVDIAAREVMAVLPTRLAQARAEGVREGVREGVEAAAQHHDELAAAHEAIVRALGDEDEFARISAMAGKEHRGYAAAIRALLQGGSDAG